MDNIHFLFANALVIYLMIVSNNCSHFKERRNFYNYGKTKRNLKHPKSQAQSKLFGHLNQAYPVRDTAVPVKEFSCPDGYRERVARGEIFCSPTKAEHELVGENEPLCPVGQMLVDSRCIDIIQHDTESHACPYGMVKFISKSQAHCVDERSIQDIPCTTGTRLFKTIVGWMCKKTNTLVQESSFSTNKLPSKEHQFRELKSGPTRERDQVDMPKCEDGKVAAMSLDGYICIDPVFPPSVCPVDRVPSMSSHGIRCVPCPYGQKVVHMGDGVKCETINSATTEMPCPHGLQSINTQIGRICQYVPPAVSGHTNNCPKGDLRLFDGKMVCTDEICPPGKTAESCLSSKLTDASYCLEGEVYYEGACIPLYLGEKFRSGSKNPCLPGHFLVVSNSGSVCQPIIENYAKGSDNALPCGPGSVLTQTTKGFQCMQGELPVHVISMCERGFVTAKLGEMYECISNYDKDLICDADEQMVRVDGGFVCEKTISYCGSNEFYHTDENGIVMCISQRHATELCGDGYTAVREADSFLCKKFKLDVTCPSGYSLSIKHGKPLCIEEGADCYDNIDLSSSGCLNQTPTCEQGYYVNVDLGVPHCTLIMNPKAEQSQIDAGVQPCDAEGSLRPCDLPTDLLLSGCNPDCANGGTCVNGTCLCPSGVSGHACDIDANECEGRPCEYRCDNTFGSYQCTCPTGMLLGTDGRSCSDQGCIPDCLNNGECLRGQCRCTSGFEGLYCQIDKDECRKYGDRLCQHQCRNTYGGYSCICPPGSRLNPDGRTCFNTTCIPECRNGGSCSNHRCQCPDGFYGIICQFDVNECRKENPCEQRCNNAWGSYVCSCNHGYRLHTDGHTCLPVLE